MYEPLHAPLADYATAENELLAELDGTQFYRVELVIKRANGQYLGVYCDYRHWEQTAAGQLAHKDAVIVFQQGLIDKLAAQVMAAEAQAETSAWQTEHATRLANENLALRTAVAQLQAELTKALNGNVTSYEQNQAAERIAEHEALAAISAAITAETGEIEPLGRPTKNGYIKLAR